MTNVTGNFSDDMRKYVVTVPPLPTTVEGVEITLPAVVFEFGTGSSTTPADVASALQEYVDKCSPVYTDHAAYLCMWFRNTTNLEEGITSAFERALDNANGHNSLCDHIASVTNLDLSYKLANELRLEWARHCITTLLSTPSPRNKEMNEKHNYKLLRPVKFKDVQVGDVLILKNSSPTSKSSVTYKSKDFVVLRFSDGSEGTHHGSRLEIDYGLAPLCWVESKPVYPGEELYRPVVEKDKALVVSHVTIKDGIEYLCFSNLTDACEYADNRRGYLTWTKPEQKREPSFQVEGQDVFPGDTVYYYGDDKHIWGREMIVGKNSYVNNVHAESFAKGAATFRLKPMLVIGDHLVPMPVRNAAEMKNGDCYYIPSPVIRDGYVKEVWSNHSFDFEVCDKGLVHLNSEAASAHTKAFIALSKKKD